MSKRMHRAQILLEPEQPKALAEIAVDIGASSWTVGRRQAPAAWKAGAGCVH